MGVYNRRYSLNKTSYSEESNLEVFRSELYELVGENVGKLKRRLRSFSGEKQRASLRQKPRKNYYSSPTQDSKRRKITRAPTAVPIRDLALREGDTITIITSSESEDSDGTREDIPTKHIERETRTSKFDTKLDVMTLENSEQKRLELKNPTPEQSIVTWHSSPVTPGPVRTPVKSPLPDKQLSIPDGVENELKSPSIVDRKIIEHKPQDKSSLPTGKSKTNMPPSPNCQEKVLKYRNKLPTKAENYEVIDNNSSIETSSTISPNTVIPQDLSSNALQLTTQHQKEMQAVAPAITPVEVEAISPRKKTDLMPYENFSSTTIARRDIDLLAQTHIPNFPKMLALQQNVGIIFSIIKNTNQNEFNFSYGDQLYNTRQKLCETICSLESKSIDLQCALCKKELPLRLAKSIKETNGSNLHSQLSTILESHQFDCDDKYELIFEIHIQSISVELIRKDYDNETFKNWTVQILAKKLDRRSFSGDLESLMFSILDHFSLPRMEKYLTLIPLKIGFTCNIPKCGESPRKDYNTAPLSTDLVHKKLGHHLIEFHFATDMTSLTRKMPMLQGWKPRWNTNWSQNLFNQRLADITEEMRNRN